MVAKPSRKRWTGAEPVGFDPSTLCHDLREAGSTGRAADSKPAITEFESLASCHRGRGGRQATALLTRHASGTAQLGSTPRPYARFVKRTAAPDPRTVAAPFPFARSAASRMRR